MDQHSKPSESDAPKQAFLVSGATGTVGRQVVMALLRKGHHVKALTRNPAGAKLPTSVEIIAGDLEAPHTLEKAFENVFGLHLITFSGAEYQPLQTGSEIVKMAKEAGVQKVSVLWSGEGKKSPVEQAVEASDLDWTILQPQEYMANVLAWETSISAESIVKEPFGSRLTAVIHEEDIGEVAATILSKGGHTCKTYTLTGPEVLTPAKQAAIISKSIHKNIQFLELSEAEAISRWKQNGFADELINYLIQWYKHPPAEGYTVLPTVEQIIGRPAKNFSQWALEHAHIFKS